MKKAIHIQTQGIGGAGTISPVKPFGWCAINFDNIKITIDAYKGSAYSGEPREDCLIQIVDEKEVFEITAEQLLLLIRFFIDYSSHKDAIIHYKNTYHYVMRDAIKPLKKG